MAVGTSGITEQDPQFFPIAEQAHPLATGQQHPLRHTAGAEAIGPAPAVGGIQVGPEAHRPGAQALAFCGSEQPAAIFRTLAGDHLRLAFQGAVTESLHQGFQHVVGHASITALLSQLAQLAPKDVPTILKGPPLGAGGFGQQVAFTELALQLELHERFRQRRTVEGAIAQLQRHQPCPPSRVSAVGTSISSPSGCGSRVRSWARCSNSFWRSRKSRSTPSASRRCAGGLRPSVA